MLTANLIKRLQARGNLLRHALDGRQVQVIYQFPSPIHLSISLQLTTGVDVTSVTVVHSESEQRQRAPEHGASTSTNGTLSSNQIVPRLRVGQMNSNGSIDRLI